MNHPKDNEINKFDWKLIKDMFAIMKPFWQSSGPQQKWYMAFFLTIVGGFTVPVLKTVYALFTQFQVAANGQPILVNDEPIPVTLESLMPGALLWATLALGALVFLLGFKEQLASRKRTFAFYGIAGVACAAWFFIQGFSMAWLVVSGVAFAMIAGSQTGMISRYKFFYVGLYAVAAIVGYNHMMDQEVLNHLGTWMTSIDGTKLHAALPYILGVLGLSAPIAYGWKYFKGATEVARIHYFNLAGIVAGITIPIVGTVYQYLSHSAAIDVASVITSFLPWTLYTTLVLGFFYGFKKLPSYDGKIGDQGINKTITWVKFIFGLLVGYVALLYAGPWLAALLGYFVTGASNPWILAAIAILLPAAFLQLNSGRIKAKEGHSLLHLLGIIVGISIPLAALAWTLVAGDNAIATATKAVAEVTDATALAAANEAVVKATTDAATQLGISIAQAAGWATFTFGFVALWMFLSTGAVPRRIYEKLGNAVASLAKYSKAIYPVAFATAAYFGVAYIYDSNLLVTLGNTLVPADGVKVTLAILFAITALAAPTAFLMLTKRWMDEGWRLLAILTALMFSVTGFNVLLTYLMRDMWDALRIQDADSFWFAIISVGVIFIVGVFIVVPYRYVRDLLGVRWRLWMSEMIIGKYMANRNYYKISQQQSVDNPEQRISQDIKAFTGGALAFLLMIMDSILVVAAFAVVLYTISPMLTIAVLGYAMLGSFFAGFIGKRLIGLNFRQEELEANFYYQSVHVRNNSEAIAFFAGEEMESKGLLTRLGEAIKNYNFVIRWERNMAFFQKGYDYLVVIVPLAIVAPLYFAGDASMGEIQQANSAFSQILSAISLFVMQFTAVTSFAANIKRLRMFEEELDKPDPSDAPDKPVIERHRGENIVVDDLTLMTPNYVRTLIKNLNLTIKRGESILVMGESGSGKSSLLRGIAGLWRSGDGDITTPDITDMMFMPQKAYLPIGSLRWQILYPDANTTATDEDIRAVLKEVNLEDLIERFSLEGGLDAELKWDEKLSGGEQQRVAMARLLLAEPDYAIVDEASSALDDANEEHVYQKLKASGTTYISVGHRKSLLKYHDRVLFLNGDGTWEILDPTDPKVQEK